MFLQGDFLLLVADCGNFAIDQSNRLTTMKTAFSRIAFLLPALAALSVSFAAMARDEEPKDQDRRIAIKKEEIFHPSRPRMPARIAIECMYEAAGESLSFQFFEAMGGVTVTVANTTTGETFFDFCPSTPGACRVALSGAPGSYAIRLEDDFGRSYSGNFAL